MILFILLGPRPLVLTLICAAEPVLCSARGSNDLSQPSEAEDRAPPGGRGPVGSSEEEMRLCWSVRGSLTLNWLPDQAPGSDGSAAELLKRRAVPPQVWSRVTPQAWNRSVRGRTRSQGADLWSFSQAEAAEEEDLKRRKQPPPLPPQGGSSWGGHLRVSRVRERRRVRETVTRSGRKANGSMPSCGNICGSSEGWRT